MKSYEEINEKIASGKAVVFTAEEIIDYVDKKGIAQAAKEVDVVTTATFGAMCSSGCFLNFGHSKPKIRMTETWLDDVPAYAGIAAVDTYLGATQLRSNDPENMYYPGDFRFGGGHVMEKLVAREKIQLFGLSYGTDEYPRKEIRTWFTIDDLNQAVMVNPRNCYQNYNVAINCSERPLYTYLGKLKPNMGNIGYSSAGQLSPLLNDPYYKTIGVGTAIWLSGAKGIVFSQGTQFASKAMRGENGVPREGAGTLAVSADMKEMLPEFVRGLSFKGYGVSVALGIGIPIPILDEEILQFCAVRDEEIFAQVIDYSSAYPERLPDTVAQVSYAGLKSGKVNIRGKDVPAGSLSSYSKALKIAEILKAEIRDGRFLLNKPYLPFPPDKAMKPLNIRGYEK